MDRHLYTCLMIDFYGQLLTKKQYEVLDMYYNNDYSLAEISEILSISRQAVSENKNRAIDTLLKYEDMLCLVKKCTELHKDISNVISLLDSLDQTDMKTADNETLCDVKAKLKHIIKEG